MLPIFEDAAVVDGIIHRKMSDPELKKAEVRNHPELPQLKQYLVLVSDEEETTEATKILDMFRLRDSEPLRGKGSKGGANKENNEDDSSTTSEDETEKNTAAKKRKAPSCYYDFCYILHK